MAQDPRIERISAQLSESAELKRRIAAEKASSILAAADRITSAFREGRKLLLCGNGGSAADCQHMATELVSRLDSRRDRPALPAIALTTDTSFLTAFSNDAGFEGVFQRQVEALGTAGDVLFAISTSGNSANVLRAVETAHRREMATIGLTGEGGKLAAAAGQAIVVPSRDTQRIQEAMLAIEHILCELVETSLFP
ncbi:MAG TPA: SIS domain-containing protein [Thermoanaerobaculia bacterium]